MKIPLSGLQRDFDPAKLRDRRTEFGPVVDAHVVRDGDPDQPWAVADMALGLAASTGAARRIDGIDYIDGFIHSRVMLRG